MNDDRIEGEIWLPTTWARSVYGRGLSRNRLVLAVSDTSPDGSTVRADVMRWKGAPSGTVARVRPAELTFRSPGSWSAAWL